MAAFKSNPLLYRTFRNVTPSEIKNFHCKDMIEFHEGEDPEKRRAITVTTTTNIISLAHTEGFQGRRQPEGARMRAAVCIGV